MAQVAKMKVWNVEKGLAVHVQAPNRKYLIVDLGSSSTVSPLKKRIIRKVPFMVITYPHHDHISDIGNINFSDPKVLWYAKSIPEEELLSDLGKEEKVNMESYLQFCHNHDGSILPENNPASGIPYRGMVVNVFSAEGCKEHKINNSSAIVVVQLGNVKIVICGDNEEESLKQLMNDDNFRNVVKDAAILVAPHHGRESGYVEEFAKWAHPVITIISDTAKSETSAIDKYDEISKGMNCYGANSQQLTFRKCLTTRKDGDIDITFSEDNLSVVCQNG